jgi:hypothetical protein
VRGRHHEVLVGSQHRQPVANAKLRQYGIDRADLQASPPTPISEFRRIDVILAVRRQKRQCREPLDDVFARPRTGEALQQFLQNEAGRDEQPTLGTDVIPNSLIVRS